MSEELTSAMEEAKACADRPADKKKLGPMFGWALEVLAREVTAQAQEIARLGEALRYVHAEIIKCDPKAKVVWLDDVQEVLSAALQSAAPIPGKWKCDICGKDNGMNNGCVQCGSMRDAAPILDKREAEIKAQAAVVEAIKDIDEECPRHIDPATICKAGVDATPPSQMVY